jgi:hypothetical protein
MSPFLVVNGERDSKCHLFQCLQVDGDSDGDNKVPWQHANMQTRNEILKLDLRAKDLDGCSDIYKNLVGGRS